MENNPQNQVISEKIITESAKKQALNPEKTSKTTEDKGKKDKEPKVENDDTGEEKKPIDKLETYLKLSYKFRYNIVKEELECKANDKESFGILSDRNKAEIKTQLAKKGYKSYKSLLDDLLLSTSFSPNFNPFTDYFEALPKWDGETDYIAKLCSYVRTTDDEWFKTMLTKHIVRTIACCLGKLEFNKYCFTFQGRQDDGKTFFVRFLMPKILDSYYKENPPLDNKDSLFALGKYMIINLDELHDLDKANANRVKSLFSQSKITERKHFGKSDSEQARYASFFGTVNERDFLNDVTGNVRWLVFEILNINHDTGGKNGYSANVKIDDVWSQAYTMLLEGFDFNLSQEEKIKVTSNNKAYQKMTTEIEIIPRYFSPSNEGYDSAIFVNATDVKEAINIATGNRHNINIINIGKAFAYLNFLKIKNTKTDRYGYWVKTDNIGIFEFLQNIPTILPAEPLKC